MELTGRNSVRLVADRDPGDVMVGHRLFVVGQDVRRGTASETERPIQRCDHRRHRPIRQRDDDPEATPRQPGTEQDHRQAVDHRPGPEVILQPRPRLRNPRLVDPAMRRRTFFGPQTALGVSRPKSILTRRTSLGASRLSQIFFAVPSLKRGESVPETRSLRVAHLRRGRFRDQRPTGE